jgi:hypothetical protein
MALITSFLFMFCFVCWTEYEVFYGAFDTLFLIHVLSDFTFVHINFYNLCVSSIMFLDLCVIYMYIYKHIRTLLI